MIANVVAFVGGGQLARKVSGRYIMLAMLPVAGLALAATCASTTLPFFMPAVLAFAISHGLVDIMMNAEGSTVESELKRPLLTGMHATVSFTVAVCALLGSLISITHSPLATAPIVLDGGVTRERRGQTRRNECVPNIQAFQCRTFKHSGRIRSIGLKLLSFSLRARDRLCAYYVPWPPPSEITDSGRNVLKAPSSLSLGSRTDHRKPMWEKGFRGKNINGYFYVISGAGHGRHRPRFPILAKIELDEGGPASTIIAAVRKIWLRAAGRWRSGV